MFHSLIGGHANPKSPPSLMSLVILETEYGKYTYWNVLLYMFRESRGALHLVTDIIHYGTDNGRYKV